MKRQSAVTDFEGMQMELGLQQTLLTVIEIFTPADSFPADAIDTAAGYKCCGVGGSWAGRRCCRGTAKLLFCVDYKHQLCGDSRVLHAFWAEQQPGYLVRNDD